jgi:SAM-dependent methyltransferase
MLAQRKTFLKRIYQEWHACLAATVPEGEGGVVELGAGEVFLERVVDGAWRTDIRSLRGLDLCADARRLPFHDGTLRALVLVDVFHHIPDAGAFLREARRVLRPGGVVAMIEPWRTPWSAFIYRWFHHEAFDTHAAWSFAEGEPMQTANGALPWIVFNRDVVRFQSRFPELRVERVEPLMPLVYLLSGGLTRLSLQPGWCYPFWRRLERRFERRCAMFAFIVLRRA